MQQTASATSMAFQRGAPDVDIARVMISLEKASVAFEAVTQTRNRLLSAYKDIMNMPV
jgi:flagellar hook-basal body complex protein FliE